MLMKVAKEDVSKWQELKLLSNSEALGKEKIELFLYWNKLYVQQLFESLYLCNFNWCNCSISIFNYKAVSQPGLHEQIKPQLNSAKPNFQSWLQSVSLMRPNLTQNPSYWAWSWICWLILFLISSVVPSTADT